MGLRGPAKVVLMLLPGNHFPKPIGVTSLQYLASGFLSLEEVSMIGLGQASKLLGPMLSVPGALISSETLSTLLFDLRLLSRNDMSWKPALKSMSSKDLCCRSRIGNKSHSSVMLYQLKLTIIVYRYFRIWGGVDNKFPQCLCARKSIFSPSIQLSPAPGV